MDYKLRNKMALVTGSTAGIGFAIAQLLAQEGATVVINGRTDERVAAAIQKIKSVCPSAKLISAPADLSEKNAIETMIQEQELFTSMRPTSLLKRFATADEVAAMVGFLCSPLSSATNGAAIRVDGGVVRAIA